MVEFLFCEAFKQLNAKSGNLPPLRGNQVLKFCENNFKAKVCAVSPLFQIGLEIRGTLNVVELR